MKRNNKTLRLTEQEFNTLIEESVKNAINEIKWGDIGNGLAAGALGAGLTAGAVGTLTQDPKQSDYWQEEEDIRPLTNVDDYDFETDAPEVPEDAWKLNGVSESKIRRIVRNELYKVL